MDGGATTSTILRGRTPTSVAGPNGGSTAIHVTALDGILHANSLFTFAAFVGLTWNPSSSGGKGRELSNNNYLSKIILSLNNSIFIFYIQHE